MRLVVVEFAANKLQSSFQFIIKFKNTKWLY